MTRIALILGANGRFASAARPALERAGWRVLAQTRQQLPPLHDTAALEAAAAGASVVIHAVNPIYTRWDAELLQLARQGMDLAQRLGATLVLPGNVYAFGEAMPARLREDTPERPSTRKGELRQQLEHELAARAARGDLRSLVLRAGDFFGQGRGNWFDLFVAQQLPRGRLRYPGPLDAVHAWAYLPDLAEALARLLDRPMAAAHERFHFPGHNATGAEFLRELGDAAERLGWARPSQQGSRLLLYRALAPVVPMLRELMTMRYLWTTPHALDGTRLAARIGPVPITPLGLALEASLRELGLSKHGTTSA